MKPEDLQAYAEFRPAWQSFAVYLLGVVIFMVGPQVNPETYVSPALGQLIGTLFLAFILVKRFSNIYRLDTQHLHHESTFPRRSQESLPIAEISRIDLRRGITQRLLGVAHVHIYLQGQGQPALKLFGVPNPDRFRQLLIELGASDERVVGAWRR